MYLVGIYYVYGFYLFIRYYDIIMHGFVSIETIYCHYLDEKS